MQRYKTRQKKDHIASHPIRIPIPSCYRLDLYETSFFLGVSVLRGAVHPHSPFYRTPLRNINIPLGKESQAVKRCITVHNRLELSLAPVKVATLKGGATRVVP